MVQYEITSGKVVGKGIKCVFYGAEGIGKSTLAASFPMPLFIDTEGSTDSMEVMRLPKPTSWQMLRDEVDFVASGQTGCMTLVIDTFDWAEQLCIDKLCADHKKKGIEDFGFGNGYVYEREEIARFLMQLEELTFKGINVVILCHAQTRKYELPEEMGQYDRWELKLGKKTSSQISPLVKEWSDMLLFLNYKTHVYATDDKGTKHKASGRDRVMYTSHHPCWDAKNRHGLPDELPLSYASIADVIPGNAVPAQPVERMLGKAQEMGIPIVDGTASVPAPEPVRTEGIFAPLADLMAQHHVTQQQLEHVSSVVFGYFPSGMPLQDYPADYQEWLTANWQTALEAVQQHCQDYVPF